MKKYLILSIIVSLLLAGVLVVKAQTTPATPDLACMKAAVEKRETAIQTAFAAFSSAITSALETRKSEISTAWTLTDKNARKDAIKAAWTKFKQSYKTTRTTFKQAKKVAWEQFITDRKACKVSVSYESRGNDLSF